MSEYKSRTGSQGGKPPRVQSAVVSTTSSQKQFNQQQQQQAKQGSSVASGSWRASGPVPKSATAVVPMSELLRIKERISAEGDAQTRERNLDKRELYEKSQTRVQNWPNTLNALRKKKGDAKFDRFVQDELERRRIDEEERAHQAAVRKEILQKANRQLYEQDDRVKAFQSKLILADALQEREEQIELKKQAAEIQKIREQMHAEQAAEVARRQAEEEERRKQVLQQKKAATAVVLRAQHDEMKQNHIKRLQQEKIEGEIIKQRALEQLEKEKEDERRRRELAAENRDYIRRHNEDLKRIKEELQKRELEEDEVIRKHAQNQDRVAEMKKIREAQIFKEKQDIKQRLIEQQAAKLQALRDRENQILSKQIKEAEIKAEQAELIKKQKQHELKQKIDESRQLTLQKRRALSAKQQQDDQDFKNFWQTKNGEIHRQEVEERNAAFERNKAVQAFQLQQAEEKRLKREQQIIAELDEAERLKKLQETDQNTFNSWAEQYIKQCEQDGKSTKPLLAEFKRLQSAK